MPDLRAQFFSGPIHMAEGTVAKLLTASPMQGILDALARDNWDGNPVATVTVSTTADGSRVADGKFALWGDLAGAAVEVPAVKLWEGAAKGTVLHIRNIMGQQFNFASGQLNSEYVDQLPFDIGYSRAGSPILPQDWRNEGIGDLSFRAICHLSKGSNRTPPPRIKYTVLGFPMSPLALAELADRTQHVSWPGIKVLEGTAALWPATPPNTWAAPFMPFINIRERQPGITTTPPGNHLLYSLAEIMRTAALPTACTTLGALNAKGQELLDANDDPETRGPSITWPPAERPPPDTGKFLLYSL